MTREEAIKIIRKMLAYTDLTVRANLNADMVSACNLAIKALEQEPILDKIRAEIASKIKRKPGLNFTLRERERNDAFLEVLDILDKYKGESEK